VELTSSGMNIREVSTNASAPDRRRPFDNDVHCDDTPSICITSVDPVTYVLEEVWAPRAGAAAAAAEESVANVAKVLLNTAHICWYDVVLLYPVSKSIALRTSS
jgi:hypothetical protein